MNVTCSISEERNLPSIEELHDALKNAETHFRMLSRIVAGIADTSLREQLNESLPQVWIAACLKDRFYGGREEGGWWYEAERIIHRKCHLRPVKAPLDQAIRRVTRLNKLADILINKHRPPISSVDSAGSVVYNLFLAEPHDRPLRKPHYE